MRALLILLAFVVSITAAHAEPVSARDVLELHSLRALVSEIARVERVPDATAQALVKRESRYNVRAVNGSAIGLTQIKLATARGLGFRGSRAQLFDPRTNLTYGLRYLHRAVAAGCECFYQKGIPR